MNKELSEYERGVIDGRQIQMQSSVDKAVNGMTRQWVGLTDEERKETLQSVNTGFVVDAGVVAQAIEAKLKEKNP